MLGTAVVVQPQNCFVSQEAVGWSAVHVGETLAMGDCVTVML